MASPLTIEDRQAIVDATILYCWAIDGKDYAALDRVFIPDVRCEYLTVRPAFNGLEPLTQILSDALDPLDCSQHMLTNHQIEIFEDGPLSRCYFQAQHVRKAAAGGSKYIVAGIYSDRWLKTAQGWRSRWRSLEVLWTDGNPEVLAR